MEDFGHANVWADDDGGTTPSNVWGDLPSSHSGIGLASALELTPDAPAIEAALPPQNPLLHMPVYEIGFDAGVEMSGEEVSGAKYGELSVVETFQPHLGSTLNEYVGASSLPVEDPSAEAFRRSSISAAADNASIVPLPPSLKSPSEDESDEVTDIGISNIPMPVQSVPVQYDPLTASVMETTPIHSLLLRGKSSGSRNDAPRAAYNSSSNSTAEEQMDDDGFGTIKTVVTDPEKVAYAMGAYVVYKVRTETTSASFENPEFTVIRRYSDFLWLHEQLQSRYPGVIIPPVPEKQTLGRFQEEFVESRRCALEQFLQRVVGHRRLRMDEALRGFLASETFAADRKKLEMRTVLNPIPTAETLNAADIRQMDEDLQRRKDHIDELEQQLKTLLRAIEEWQRQQLELSQATHVMGEHIHALSTVDVKLPISRKLAILADAHHNIKTLQERQGKQSISAFMTTADFYLRAIASVNVAFSARLKAYHAWQQTEQVLQRKREALEKVQSKSIRTDKIALVTAEVQEAEASATAATNEYIYVSQGLQSELGRFHMEIVNDFISSMRTMVMSFAEAQRQVTGFWEACMYID